MEREKFLQFDLQSLSKYWDITRKTAEQYFLVFKPLFVRFNNIRICSTCYGSQTDVFIWNGTSGKSDILISSSVASVEVKNLNTFFSGARRKI